MNMQFLGCSALISLGVIIVSATSALAADPIKIGVPVGLSGANSVVAPSVVQSAQLAGADAGTKAGAQSAQPANLLFHHRAAANRMPAMPARAR